jgi:hypothetical protein
MAKEKFERKKATKKSTTHLKKKHGALQLTQATSNTKLTAATMRT